MKLLYVRYTKSNDTREVDTAAIEARLQEVNGRASHNSITSIGVLSEIAARAEAVLECAGIKLGLRPGAEVRYTPAGPYANSYRFAATSTGVTLKRNSQGWYLVHACKTKIYPKQPERFLMSVSASAAEYAAQKVLVGIGWSLDDLAEHRSAA